jgi:hypothetical protein
MTDNRHQDTRRRQDETRNDKTRQKDKTRQHTKHKTQCKTRQDKTKEKTKRCDAKGVLCLIVRDKEVIILQFTTYVRMKKDNLFLKNILKKC